MNNMNNTTTHTTTTPASFGNSFEIKFRLGWLFFVLFLLVFGRVLILGFLVLFLHRRFLVNRFSCFHLISVLGRFERVNGFF